MSYTIFMGNLGYLRGLDGGLAQHVIYAHRHVYCSVDVQKRALRQLKAIIARESPDLCCFVEIEQGSANSGHFNQMQALESEEYPYRDVENKYALSSRLRGMALMRGKSNGFMAKQALDFEKIYFTHGTKRLIYKLMLANGVTVFFAHFSLKKSVRTEQLKQAGQLLAAAGKKSMFLGDFNILSGFQELAPLFAQGNFQLLNRRDVPTFRFHRNEQTLDLCIAAAELAPHLALRVVAQEFSDHAALLLQIQESAAHMES
jgi:endonuclease/exonuclease/phosphatase family metal-dependent hydrolase